MKGNRRLLALGIALSLLLLCAAAGESVPAAQFVYVNGITWDTSPEDLFKAVEAGESERFEHDGVSMYVIEYPPVFEERVRLSCTYFGEQLAIIGAYYVGETDADYAARLAALTGKYGEPTEYDPDVLDKMFRLIINKISEREPRVDGWLLEDGTRVYLLLDYHMYEYYMNEDVVVRMNETLPE